MNEKLMTLMGKTRQALVEGRSEQALGCLADMTATLEHDGIAPDSVAELESELGKLRTLATAVLAGQQQAVDYLRAAFDSARSLQTYDRTGRRQVSSVADQPAKRF